MYNRGQVPESTGSSLKIDFYMLLFSKKIQKIEFFKTPSFDFDDTSIGCCPHVWYCNPCLRKLPEFGSYIVKISAYVFYKLHGNFIVISRRLLFYYVISDLEYCSLNFVSFFWLLP